MVSKPRGVIFAGGTGTRLQPLTYITNKHLLPVFDRPMIMYPIDTLKNLGIKDICIVTGENHIADFKKYFGDGSKFGVAIAYRTQPAPTGIADALLKSEDFFDGKKAVGICGDMLCGSVDVPPDAFVDDFAYIFIYERSQSWGAVPEFDKRGNIIGIEEKPKLPKSKYLVSGLYIYPNDVFDYIKKLKPSQRGEFEITDVNNWYIKQKRLKALKMDTYIADAGTFETLLKSSIFRAKELGYNVDYDQK